MYLLINYNEENNIYYISQGDFNKENLDEKGNYQRINERLIYWGKEYDSTESFNFLFNHYGINPVNIKIEDKSYHCGDGCCSKYWQEVSIKGKLLETKINEPKYDGSDNFHYEIMEFYSGYEIIQAVLNHYGKNCEAILFNDDI